MLLTFQINGKGEQYISLAEAKFNATYNDDIFIVYGKKPLSHTKMPYANQSWVLRFVTRHPEYSTYLQ